MTVLRLIACVATILIHGALPPASFSQQLSCPEVAKLARLAGEKSIEKLQVAKQSLPSGYAATLVFASRSFELQLKSRDAARQLLAAIPADDTQQQTLITLGDSQCPSETVQEMKALAMVSDKFPANLAKAVLICRELMPAYIVYSLVAVHDPHNDYALRMQSVCRDASHEFRQAIESLPAERRNWFIKRVIDPQTCRALALPEQE